MAYGEKYLIHFYQSYNPVYGYNIQRDNRILNIKSSNRHDYCKQYHRMNFDKLQFYHKQQRLKYYESHKENLKARNKEYYRQHIDAIRERNRKYREKHREELREKRRLYESKRRLENKISKSSY